MNLHETQIAHPQRQVHLQKIASQSLTQYISRAGDRARNSPLQITPSRRLQRLQSRIQFYNATIESLLAINYRRHYAFQSFSTSIMTLPRILSTPMLNAQQFSGRLAINSAAAFKLFVSYWYHVVDHERRDREREEHLRWDRIEQIRILEDIEDFENSDDPTSDQKYHYLEQFSVLNLGQVLSDHPSSDCLLSIDDQFSVPRFGSVHHHRDPSSSSDQFSVPRIGSVHHDHAHTHGCSTLLSQFASNRTSIQSFKNEFEQGRRQESKQEPRTSGWKAR